jgi:hypothetical protein
MQGVTQTRKLRFLFLRLFLVMGIGVVGMCGLCFVISQAYLWLNPPPPGFRDSFTVSSAGWNTSTIGDFLDGRIPADAADLTIEVKTGVTGSYGMNPSLSFSFWASPESATAFVNKFCQGVLYPGYNPLEAVDSAIPTSSSVLIRAGGSIHYSLSEGVPDSVRGNRCSRHDVRTGFGWVEEWVLDTSDPDSYRVFYRLPYDANGNPIEFYPQARFVNPAGNRFRLYVTGISATSESDIYSVDYPILCFETASLPSQYDFFYWNPSFMQPFEGAAITVLVDNLEQPPASVTEFGVLTPLHTSTTSRFARWSYCLETRRWQHSRHSVDFRIQPLSGEALSISFFVNVPVSDS